VKIARTITVLFALVLGGTVAAVAQSTSAAPNSLQIDLSAGAVASFQPPSLASPLVFEGGVGGTVPGWAVEGVLGHADGLIVGVGLSTTREFSRVRGGRAVGPASLSVTHRDTLVSFLVGMRKPVPLGQFEVKGGPSLVYASTVFLERPIPDVSSRLGFTASVTYSIRLSSRSFVDTSLAYSRVSRGTNSTPFGLGKSIFRPGIGVRVRL
jgi:hypothetical protein